MVGGGIRSMTWHTDPHQSGVTLLMSNCEGTVTGTGAETVTLRKKKKKRQQKTKKKQKKLNKTV